MCECNKYVKEAGVKQEIRIKVFDVRELNRPELRDFENRLSLYFLSLRTY